MLIENLDLNLRNVLVLNRSSSFAVSFQSSEQEIGCTGLRCEGSDLSLGWILKKRPWLVMSMSGESESGTPGESGTDTVE